MPTSDIAWAIADVKERQPAYSLACRYDEGDHRLTFATQKYLNTFGALFREFADNMCDDVVDGLSDRLQITAWTCEDDKVAAAMDTIWERNRGASRFGQVHRHGYREGDGFLMAQSDAQHLARFYTQKPDHMAVRYSTDNPDEVVLVAKVWKDVPLKRYRLNLLYPDHMEKYATSGVGSEGGIPGAKAFKPLPAAEMDDPAMSPTAIETDGIPVWHYPNGTLSEYGRSILANIIPLQDGLNKSVSDMLVAMEFLAFPQRWAVGVQVERNPVTGNEESPFRAGVDRIWRTGNKDAQLGQFQAAEMTNFLEVQDSFRLEIARKGRMAPGTVQMRSGVQAPPSGVSLLVMDGGAIKMSRDRQRDWGHNHREAMAYAVNLENPGMNVTAEDIDIEWAPPETRDEKAMLEALVIKKDLGVSNRRLLLEAGYDTDEADEFLSESMAEDEAARQAALVASGGRVAPTSIGAARTLTEALGGGQNAALGIPAPPSVA